MYMYVFINVYYSVSMLMYLKCIGTLNYRLLFITIFPDDAL